MSSDPTSIRARLRLARFRPGGRRGTGRERLPVHQPPRQRLDPLAARSVTTTPGSPGRTTTTRRAASRPATLPSASAPRRPTCSSEPLDNVIAGRELIAEAIAGTWGHAEAGRLGNETSEGALTWNVLRSLQEAGRLGVAASALTAGGRSTREPELGFWGRRIERDAGRAVARPRRTAPTRASTFPAGAGS